MVVKAIIKMEMTVNVTARSYVVILTLFIEVFGVICWQLSNMEERDSIWLFNSMHSLLHIQEIKTKLMEPKAVSYFFFAENSSFFMSAPFMLVWDFLWVQWSGTVCLYIFLFYVCVCWAFVDNHLAQLAFCNHMMTAHDEVTVNSEPVLIITCVCFWIYFT